MGYQVEVRKNGVVLAVVATLTLNEAMVKAQTFANRVKTTVRVIDLNRADGVTLVTPA